MGSRRNAKGLMKEPSVEPKMWVMTRLSALQPCPGNPHKNSRGLDLFDNPTNPAIVKTNLGFQGNPYQPEDLPAVLCRHRHRFASEARRHNALGYHLVIRFRRPINVPHQLQAACMVFNQRRAVFDPITCVAVDDAVNIELLRSVCMAADH